MNDARPRQPGAVAPVIDLARIREIRTIEVMEFELDAIEQIVADEQASLGCFTASVGVLVGAVLGWVGASELTRPGEVLFATTTIVAAIFSAWFLWQWRSARRRRPTLLRELRARARPR